MLIPVILSGGAGTRLWPVSREGHPKPFMKLPDGESLLFKTYRRARRVAEPGEILTVTNREYFFLSRDEFQLALPQEAETPTFLLEPFGRNTAPAIALAALQVAERHGAEAQMLVMPADHLIHDEALFARTVQQAAALAAQGHLVTFGIQPTAPETGYGYIEAGQPVNTTVPQGNHVVRFIEKPARERAEQLLAAGNYLWNSGMFCFAAQTMLDALQQHAPEVLHAARACLADARIDHTSHATLVEIQGESFREAPDISIDYAVMEKSGQVAVVPGAFGWNDIGSWAACPNPIPMATAPPATPCSSTVTTPMSTTATTGWWPPWGWTTC